jgi:hypothetical protein
MRHMNKEMNVILNKNATRLGCGNEATKIKSFQAIRLPPMAWRKNTIIEFVPMKSR